MGGWYRSGTFAWEQWYLLARLTTPIVVSGQVYSWVGQRRYGTLLGNVILRPVLGVGPLWPAFGILWSFGRFPGGLAVEPDNI